nr:MAG: hypothetical protein 1 [Leviviridae sp.]
MSQRTRTSGNIDTTFAPALSADGWTSVKRRVVWTQTCEAGKPVVTSPDLYGLKTPMTPDILVRGPRGFYFDYPKREAVMQAFIRDNVQTFIDALGLYPPVSEQREFVTGDNRQVTTDVVTAGFHRIKSSGGIVNNPFHSVRRDYKFGFTPDNQVVEHTLSFPDSSSSPQIWRFYFDITVRWKGSPLGLTAGAYTKLRQYVEGSDNLPSTSSAVNQAYKNMDAADLEVLVALAEARSTFATFVSAANRLASIQRTIKKGQFYKIAPKTWKRYLADSKVSPRKISDYFLDAWMEARYGWRPLIYDVNGALKALNGDAALSPRHTFRGGDAGGSSEQIAIDIADSGYHYEGTLTLSTEWRVRAGVIGEARMKSSFPKKLGLFNVATAAWDLVPYSFVADWFIDVSGTLSSINPNPIYKTLATWASVSLTKSMYGQLTVTARDGTQNPMNIHMEVLVRDRQPNAERSFLQFDLNFSQAKLIDSVALLRRWR